ncbi:MAG: bifunctional folylpolyglutamate synthase/dihydrofolate synthase [Planctomycetota bacterium]
MNDRFRNRGFLSRPGALSPALERVLARLDKLVNLERADRSEGAAGAGAVRRVDLRPVRDLLERLGDPQNAFPAVHVAGTKGKGSVSALVAAAAARAGYRVGLYTSPHVESVVERVAVEGRPIAPDRLAGALEGALDARDAATRHGTSARDASWFDVLTAAALAAFAEARLDLAVVEVGLGGRLDSTNVVRSEVCVVTNIDLEHTAILGSTRAAIAGEKAGIVRHPCAVVTGIAPDDAEAAPPLLAAVAAAGASLRHVAQNGPLSARNLALAAAAVEELAARGWAGRGATPLAPELVDDASVQEAARLPGRGECLQLRGIPVVLDGAHVPSSLRVVLDDLEGDSRLRGRPQALLGVGLDKDAAGLLKVLRDRVDRVFCTSAGDGPYRAPQELLALASRLGIAAEASPPGDALQAAVGRAQPDGWVLVTGSLHLVGAVRSRIPSSPEDPSCSPSYPTSS